MIGCGPSASPSTRRTARRSRSSSMRRRRPSGRGGQAWLNRGRPAWRSHLVEQVSALLGDYGLRAVFFDTHHIWENDPDYPLYEGLVALRDELRSRFPELLVPGEGWYDALGAVTPGSHGGAPP